MSKYVWPVSSGSRGHDTPTGNFKPVWMSKMWYSRQYEYAPMPNAIFFHGGAAIHGTAYVGSLGRPASHGCVRLAPRNAATLYKLVGSHGKAATRISVHGTPNHGAEPEVASRRQDRRYRRVRRLRARGGQSAGLLFAPPLYVRQTDLLLRASAAQR